LFAVIVGFVHSGRQFYDSALTDHENAFSNITKTHEKVHKNACKSLQKRIEEKKSSAKNKRERVPQFKRSIL